MADNDRSVLGDINPVPDRSEQERKAETRASGESEASTTEDQEQPQHSGSRDVTEATPGATGGGTRNYRQGTGAVGMDIGNRPE